MTGAQALKRNDATYLDLLGLIARMGPRHRMATAALVEATAEFCEFNHPGRFADGALENYLLDLIDDSEPTVEVQATPMSAFSRRRVLHVATQVCGVGGHTRTIRHWIAADSESQHSLLLTSQGDAAIPNWLGDAVRGLVSAHAKLGGIVYNSAKAQRTTPESWLGDFARAAAEHMCVRR